MLKKKQRTNIIVEASPHNWKKRPSEIRGYQRTLYLTTDEGDYIRVDYHLKEKRVRLYVELSSEGGSPYYSVISNGTITSEKSVSSGRTYGLSGKFNAFAEVFSTIPNKEVIKLIGKNYGIGATTDKKSASTKRQQELEVIKKRYFKGEDGESTTEGGSIPVGIIGRPKLVDIIDIGIGLLLSAGVFVFFQFSYIAMGMTAAFFGLIIGIVDFFIRGRAPLFFKVIFFLLAGSVSYIYGYYFY